MNNTKLSIELISIQRESLLNQLLGEKVKFKQLSFETKQCVKCLQDIDMSMDYAFENEICPYCGCNIIK